MSHVGARRQCATQNAESKYQANFCEYLTLVTTVPAEHFYTPNTGQSTCRALKPLTLIRVPGEHSIPLTLVRVPAYT